MTTVSVDNVMMVELKEGTGLDSGKGGFRSRVGSV